MTVLQPPYTVEQRGARVLIVPQRSHPTQTPPLHALCEVPPYGQRATPVELGEEIVKRINLHGDLRDTLADMLRAFGPRKDGQTFTPLQKSALLTAVSVLKQVSETNEKKGNAA